MERLQFVRRMKDFACFVQALTFQNQIGGVLMELPEMRPDFANRGTMRGKIERLVFEFVELPGRATCRSAALHVHLHSPRSSVLSWKGSRTSSLYESTRRS